MSKTARVGWAMGQLKYAESVMYRQNLYNEAIAGAEREMAKIPDCEKDDPAVQAEIKLFNETVASLRVKYAERELKNAWEELERKVKARWQDINNNHPRFPDRVVTAIGELEKL